MRVILGKKIGMTSLFGPTGNIFPVTVIQAGPCVVTQVKTKENDSYEAIQLGFEERKEKSTNKPMAGHFKKQGVNPMRFLKEFRYDGAENSKVGETITAEIFSAGDQVHVTGTSKGKGFQGVVKRHGFKLQGKSHGTHESKRGVGSIGMCADPAKVIKGKKMPGRMGTDTVTVKNLEVLKVDAEKNIIMVIGSVPGGKNGLVKIVAKEV